jgi:hypothetical protein
MFTLVRLARHVEKQKLHTIRYKTVIRDQRCLYRKLVVAFSHCSFDEWGSLLTQISSTYKIMISKMPAPAMVSAYLWSERKS